MLAMLHNAENRDFKRVSEASSMGYHGRVGIPQAGRLVVIALTNNVFQENGVEFTRDAEGRITKFGYNTNANIAAGAASAAQSLDQIRTIGVTIASADVVKKQQEVARLQAEANLIKAQRELDRLRRD